LFGLLFHILSEIPFLRLDLSHNVLSRLPWNLGYLVQIEILDVSHNNLIVPPRSAVNMGTPAILKWLRENRKEGSGQRITGLGMKTHSEADKANEKGYSAAKK
jgi:hypothetical protein